jgi:hypothetical protein
MKTIIGTIAYLEISKACGYHELCLSDEDYAEFKLMSEERQKEWLEFEGTLIVDDYIIEDFGEITSITIN